MADRFQYLELGKAGGAATKSGSAINLAQGLAAKDPQAIFGALQELLSKQQQQQQGSDASVLAQIASDAHDARSNAIGAWRDLQDIRDEDHSDTPSVPGGIAALLEPVRQDVADAVNTLQESFSGLWDVVLEPDTSNMKAGEALQIAGSVAWQQAHGQGYRHYWSPNFITYFMDTQNIVHLDNYPNLLDCWPGANEEGESDLEMLQRLHPEYTWAAGAHLGLISATLDDVNPVVFVTYSPPLDLATLKQLFTYTPTSGPPDRSIIKDLILLATMIPVQYGSG